MAARTEARINRIIDALVRELSVLKSPDESLYLVPVKTVTREWDATAEREATPWVGVEVASIEPVYLSHESFRDRAVIRIWGSVRGGTRPMRDVLNLMSDIRRIVRNNLTLYDDDGTTMLAFKFEESGDHESERSGVAMRDGVATCLVLCEAVYQTDTTDP
jgi:hypothetical protein